MDSLPLNLDDLKRLVALFDEHQLIELEVRESGVRVRLEAVQKRAATVPTAEEIGEYEEIGYDPGSIPAPEPSIIHEPSPEEKGWVAITAPMTGTFYRAPAPSDPPYVEVGQPVEPEDVIGIVEAMKMLNEIHSEVAGTVMELPVQNAQMVQPGQPLAWIQPL